MSLVLSMAVAVLLAGLLIRSGRREPTYQGHPVEYWAKSLWAGSPSEQTAAQEAIRCLGTNAIPRLASMLRKKDSRFKASFLEVVGRQWLVRYPYLDHDFDQQRLALKAVRVLGDSARPILPCLQEIIKDWKNRSVDVVYGAIEIAKGWAPGTTPDLILGDPPPRLQYPNGITAQ